MTATQIEGVSLNELIAKIGDTVINAITTTTQPGATIADQLSNTTIDRNFIKRNLKCSQRIIFKYERLGILRPVYNMADTKTIYYKLSDYIAMCEALSLK